MRRRQAARFRERHRPNSAAFPTAFGASQAFLERLEARIPPEDMGERARVTLTLMPAVRAAQVQPVLPEFIAQANHLETPFHRAYCI